ncbi:SLAM family member 9-like [Misgurnus anguillicaudatus]|uniref:SLAM family member 9-like n=1 Tax=Misgurnus anguillicaudatus TaxID=75329 RepID=UPI003CCF5821
MCLCSSGVFGDEVKSVSVMEGDSVTLPSNITEILRDDVIQWMFVVTNESLVRFNKAANKTTIYANVFDGRFRDRLQVNNLTGDLIITNITTQHTGLYRVIITSATEISYRFNVIVYARLPVPVITTQNSSSSERASCVFECSVMNVTDVSLSWYKGNSLLSSISVSDLNISSISLHLKCLDDSYSCVVNNPISNQTQHLNTDLCQTCSGCVCCCNGPEAVIRLVISTLVGVATVTVLVYDIYSNSGGDAQKKRSKTPSDHH